MTISEKIKRIDSRINNQIYVIAEMTRMVFAPGKKMRILFSAKRSEWEKRIRSGFVMTTHEIEFDEFTPENIKKSDLVVPLTISDLELLNNDRNLVQDNAIPIPRLETIRLCSDKYQFYLALKKNGFEHAMPRVDANLPYPYILKRKYAECGNDCYIISNPDQEKQYRELVNSEDFFHQEVIESINEYATHILFKDNEIQASLTMKYTWRSKTAINGKEDSVSCKIARCPHLELFSAILNSIGFQGLCCFDYKVVDGKPYIFEINPRFGGSLCSFFFSFMRHLDTSGQRPAA